MFSLLLLGFLIGGTTAGILCSIIYSRASGTLTAEHTLRQQQAYAQGYHDRALLALGPEAAVGSR